MLRMRILSGFAGLGLTGVKSLDSPDAFRELSKDPRARDGHLKSIINRSPVLVELIKSTYVSEKFIGLRGCLFG